MNRMRQRVAYRGWRVLAFVAGVSTAGVASTAEAETTERDFLADVPVVLTASRLGQPAAEAPNAITIFDRDFIQATGAREIAELFRFVPGMYVTYVTYVGGLQALVAYHGLASEYTNRLQVLVDGRTVYNPTVGEVSWTNLPLHIDDIERIEVVRGPAAASHGANSFTGVINIITRHPAQDRGVHAALMRGTNAIDERLLRYGGAAGALDFRLTAAYRADDTYADVADSRRVHLLTFRGDYRLGSRDVLTLQAGYNGGARETQAPSSVQPEPVDHPRQFTVHNYFEQLQWVRALSGGDELSVQLYHNHMARRDLILTDPIALVGGERFQVDNNLRADRYDVELQHTMNVRPGLRWVWGAGWRYDSSYAPSWFGAKVHNHSRRLFGHAEWRASPRWLLNAGAMVEYTDFTGTDVSPRLAVNYQLAPGHALRAGISRALRNPTLVEEKADLRFTLGPLLVQRFLMSGNLEPERILSRDLGYVGELGRGISLDVRAFSDRLTGLIGEVVVPYPPAFNGITRDVRNLNDVEQRGIESQLRWNLSRHTRLAITQSHVRTSSNNATANFSAAAPRNTYSLIGMHELRPGLSGTLTLLRQDKTHVLFFAEPQAAIKRVDARIAQRFRLGRSRAEASLVVQDLLNGKHTDFRHDNVFDRRGYGTLEVFF